MHRKIVRLAVIALLLSIVVAGFGQAVRQLWNWLMPDLFGLRPITYWQALGLMGLSWILFRAGFLGGPHRSYGHRWARWEQMTPEERDKFRRGLECGHRGGPPPEPKV